MSPRPRQILPAPSLTLAGLAIMQENDGGWWGDLTPVQFLAIIEREDKTMAVEPLLYYADYQEFLAWREWENEHASTSNCRAHLVDLARVDWEEVIGCIVSTRTAIERAARRDAELRAAHAARART